MRSIDDAIMLGEDNQRAIELMRAWCSHARAELSPHGGVGLVEQQTGLPIGMRYFACPHAKNRGMHSMNLMALAIQFYDSNCVGCAHRKPVAFPNISNLVEERDQQKKQSDEQQARAQSAEIDRLGARTKRRDSLRKEADTSTIAILDAIDRLDAGCNSESTAHLRNTIKAAGHLSGEIETALQELAEEPNHSRTNACLFILNEFGKNRLEIVRLALLALGWRTAIDTAADIVESELLKGLESDLIVNSLPSLVFLAAPRHTIGFESPKPKTRPIKKIARLYSKEFEKGMRLQIRNKNKDSRASAMKCLTFLDDEDWSVLESLILDVCSSLELPDDPYDSGPAANSAAQSLAHCLVLRPKEADKLIRAVAEKLTPEVRGLVFKAYVEVLGDWWKADHKPDSFPGDVFSIAYDRIIELLSTRSADASFKTAVEYFEWVGHYCPLNASRITALLGVATLLASDISAIPIASALEVKPDPMKALETFSKNSLLDRGVAAARKAIASAAKSAPERILPELIIACRINS